MGMPLFSGIGHDTLIIGSFWEAPVADDLLGNMAYSLSIASAGVVIRGTLPRPIGRTSATHKTLSTSTAHKTLSTSTEVLI